MNSSQDMLVGELNDKSKYKPLPNGWVYLLTKKDLRALQDSFPGLLWKIEFDGTGLISRKKNEPQDLWSAGGLERRSTEFGWRFKLSLSGIPAKILGDERDEFRANLLSEIETILREFRSKPHDSIAKPMDHRFWHRLVYGDWQADFSERTLDDGFSKYLSEIDPWWE